MYFLKKGQARVDEFAFVLLAGVILIIILMIVWTTPTEPMPLVEPSSISLSIPRNLSKTFDLEIIGTLTNVTLSSKGQIRDWITFSKNRFDVLNSTIVTVKVKIPRFTNLGTYTGDILVKSTGGEKSVPVSIEVTKYELQEFHRSIPLGDFNVRYSVGSDVLDSKESFEVYKGYFSDSQKSLVGVLTDEKLAIVTDGYVQLIVEETNSEGNLIVLFNGQKVFNEKVGPGSYKIPIDKSKIGESNTITIKAGLPGWKFWMNTVYKFRVATFVANYMGIFSKEVTFPLEFNEATNFDHFLLSYRVKNYSLPLPELIIRINNQMVFSDRPPLAFFNKELKNDVLGNPIFLNVGDNVISFLFESEAYYEITDAVLSVYYVVPP